MKAILIIAGILVAVAPIAISVIKACSSNGNYSPKKLPIISGIAIGLALITLGAAIVVIPTGYTGVKSTFGQVDPNPVPTGFSFKAPLITSVEKVNNKQQDYELSAENVIWGETKARTAISFSGITVTAKINPEYSAWMVANISNYKETLITEAVVSSALKTVTKTLSDEEATNRGTIERLAKEELQKSLNDKYSKELIFVDKVTISNADFEESYNTAIAEKQKAQLAYEQQQIENKKAIEKAEADAEVKKAKAQGEADAAIIAAEGEKKANELLEQSLSDKIIKNKAVDKWNGELPQVMGENGVLMDLTGSAEASK